MANDNVELLDRSALPTTLLRLFPGRAFGQFAQSHQSGRSPDSEGNLSARLR